MAIKKTSPFLIFFVFLQFVVGCATTTQSTPITRPPGPKTVSVTNSLPDGRYLPEQSAPIANSNYVMIQASGGSIFLGPILGSLNIEAQTKALADKYKGQYLSVSPVEISKDALSPLPIYKTGGASGYVIHPFAFAQRCYDENFRISLVFHVESTVTTDGWVGRYTYHLPTAIPVSDFANPTDEQLNAFHGEMLEGAKVLANLLEKDISGTLPNSGGTVSFGSLYIIGNKLGGMGIYTMPEERYFKDVELLEETDSYITVRIKKGNMHATAVVGGMAFGIHRIDKRLVHTFKPS